MMHPIAEIALYLALGSAVAALMCSIGCRLDDRQAARMRYRHERH